MPLVPDLLSTRFWQIAACFSLWFARSIIYAISEMFTVTVTCLQSWRRLYNKLFILEPMDRTHRISDAQRWCAVARVGINNAPNNTARCPTSVRTDSLVRRQPTGPRLVMVEWYLMSSALTWAYYLGHVGFEYLQPGDTARADLTPGPWASAKPQQALSVTSDSSTSLEALRTRR